MFDVNSIPWHNIRRDLKSFVKNRVRDSAIADDVVQEVFLKVHNGVSELRDPARFNSWIFQVTRNAISDHFRHKNKTIASEPIPTESEDTPNSYNACMANCLQKELQNLPAKYREALELADIGSLSQLELAQRLQLSYSGAKSRVQRARLMLRTLIEKKYAIETDTYGNIIVCEDKHPNKCQRSLIGD